MAKVTDPVLKQSQLQNAVVRGVKVMKLKKSTYVNCWSMGRHESYALWKIFMSGSSTGVAIRTTVSNLEKSLRPEEQTSISTGCVNYTNFLQTNTLTDAQIVCSKSEPYRYECEYRLWIHQETAPDLSNVHSPKPPDGRLVDVDIQTLINTIYISPFVNAWFQDIFRITVERLAPSLTAKIRLSDVQDS